MESNAIIVLQNLFYRIARVGLEKLMIGICGISYCILLRSRLGQQSLRLRTVYSLHASTISVIQLRETTSADLQQEAVVASPWPCSNVLSVSRYLSVVAIDSELDPF